MVRGKKTANAVATTVEALLKMIDSELANYEEKIKTKIRKALIISLRDANRTEEPKEVSVQEAL